MPLHATPGPARWIRAFACVRWAPGAHTCVVLAIHMWGVWEAGKAVCFGLAGPSKRRTCHLADFFE